MSKPCSVCGGGPRVFQSPRCLPCAQTRARVYYAKRKTRTPGPAVHSKVCGDCSTEKQAADFAPAALGAGGLHSYCRVCKALRAIRSTYRVDPSKVLFIWQSQGRACAICRKDLEFPSKTFHVDHDHATGRVRGVLCSSCNRGIGYLQENPEILRRAAEYLS